MCRHLGTALCWGGRFLGLALASACRATAERHGQVPKKKAPRLAVRRAACGCGSAQCRTLAACGARAHAPAPMGMNLPPTTFWYMLLLLRLARA